MQILLVAAGMSFLSGEDRRIIELGKRWIEKGHEIECLIPASSLKMCQQEGLKARYITFPPVLSDATSLNIGLVWAIRAVAASACLPRNWCGDVVYSRSRLYPDLIPAWILKKRHRDAKWIVSVAHWIRSPGRRPRGSMLDWVSNYGAYLLEQAGLVMTTRCADMITTHNKSTSEEISQRTRASIALTGDGIDRALIDAVTSPQIEYDASFVGRIHPTKGISDLIRAWRLVCDRRPNAKLAIVGGTLPGKAAYEQSLRDKARELGLEKNITFLGFLETKEVFRTIKSSRVFVFPSYEEGWGLAILEAMACKVPVIAYDLQIYREIFGDSLCTVPIGDIASLAEQIDNLLANSNLRQFKSDAGYLLTAEYDWDIVAEQEMARIEGIMAA